MQNKKIRLNKAIASSGLCSRRKAEELIKSGKVKVNGKVISELAYYIFKDDDLEVDGKKLKEKSHRYVLFHKPKGYITTSKDEHGRDTIYSLLPKSFLYLKSAGRLDSDSEGLLVLSNDGYFLNELQSPKSNIQKSYLIKLQENLSDIEKNHIMQKLLKGLLIDGKTCKIDEIRKINIRSQDKKHYDFEVVIHEGRNRQIRRLFQKLGYTVSRLKRIKVGSFYLGEIKKGSYREISKQEAYAYLQEKYQARGTKI